MTAKSLGAPRVLVCGMLLIAATGQMAGCTGHESGVDPNIKVEGPPSGGNPPPSETKITRKGKPVRTIWDDRREAGKVAKD